jgi:glutathione-specific gamma-glutamylcyclotransferase
VLHVDPRQDAPGIGETQSGTALESEAWRRASSCERWQALCKPIIAERNDYLPFRAADAILERMRLDGSTWVFGYGSLIWHQDFPFREARRAYIDGWTRRFWQGSHDHRGVPGDPGRVVTLIESPGERCYGRAFLVDAETFAHLDHRERNGYERYRLPIHFADAHVPGVVYVAPVNNVAYLGEAPVEEIAAQIRRCAGPSGHNRDYVIELARALRDLGIHDPHVFEIEARL